MKIKNALVVDDEKEICFLIKFILKKIGIDTSVAHSITELIENYNPGSFDLIFLDIKLPDGNGIDFIPYFKEKNDSAIVVVISAFDADQECKKAFSLGADHFLGKPFTGKEIIKMIDPHNN